MNWKQICGVAAITLNVSACLSTGDGDKIEVPDKFAMRDMLIAGKFDEIEAIADVLRRSDARTPSGTPKMRVLHDNLSYGLLTCQWLCDGKAAAWMGRYPQSPLPLLAEADVLVEKASGTEICRQGGSGGVSALL